MLYMLKGILIPLAFSVMIAILLNPFVNKLQQKKIPSIPAIIIALLLTIFLVAGLMVFISSQMVKFSDNMPVLEQKFSQLFRNLQLWLQENYSFSIDKQRQMLIEAGNNLKPLIGQTLGGVLGTLSVIVLLPIYIFLILFYKTLILNFLYEVFAEKNSSHVGERSYTKLYDRIAARSNYCGYAKFNRSSYPRCSIRYLVRSYRCYLKCSAVHRGNNSYCHAVAYRNSNERWIQHTNWNFNFLFAHTIY